MVTPARRQYLAIKEQYPDALLLYQIGDFYETFDDDARLLARDAEVALTSKTFGRDGRVPLAGIPVRALDAYLRRLAARGHRVAVCEQVSEAGHGLVERAVTRIVTPGTIAEPQLLPERENNYLAAVLRATGRGGVPEAGLAYVDVSTGEFAATTFAGPDAAAALAAELQRLNPAEILAPDDASSDTGPGHRTPRPRAAFDPERGAEALCAHFGVDSLEGYGVHDRPLARGAAAAILGYLRENRPDLLAGLTGLRTYDTGDFMTLDGQTRRNLELMQSGRWERTRRGQRERGARGLLGVLDRTRTSPGGRLLRRWLGQPLLDLAALAARHDAVEELLGATDARAAAREALGRVGDLERLAGRILARRAEPRELLALRAALDQIPALAAALAALAASLTAGLRDALDPCEDVADLIERAVAGAHEGRRIRPGFDADLDGMVAETGDARRWIAELEQRERARTSIKSLRVGYNKVFGYYLEVTRPNLKNVPDDYLRKQTLAAGERFITPELKEYEARIADAENRIAEQEDRLYAGLLATLAGAAPRLLATAAALAQLDVLAAFAEVAARQGYARPCLNGGSGLRIVAGRHPTVEAALDHHAFVPNDTAFDDDARVLLLTGPNMAGKSTYLRQVALIVLLAQIGSFVPAERAELGLVDRIFTRIGAQDDLTAGQSTFMVEMLETAAILHHATTRSLIVLDEVGRGTSTQDGLAIARAVIEDLHDRLGARTLFAT
ncbi:MAG TPA: DNA mismatch repair protein MutS, partial [Thermomicrobiales bacterium]|nr:DNA mismatch repair protein MutS [Thermomicrobiales bacterium]